MTGVQLAMTFQELLLQSEPFHEIRVIGRQEKWECRRSLASDPSLIWRFVYPLALMAGLLLLVPLLLRTGHEGRVIAVAGLGSALITLSWMVPLTVTLGTTDRNETLLSSGMLVTPLFMLLTVFLPKVKKNEIECASSPLNNSYFL